MENNPNYRYERKYIIDRCSLPYFLKDIYKNGFVEIYESRKVNNIYFDTLGLSSYYENIDGLSYRKKFRVRWYGERFGKSLKTFEMKIKSEFLNKKKSYSLGLINFEGSLDIHKACLVEKISKFLLKNNYQNKLMETLYNNYSRRYFYCKKRNIRITIDEDLNFYSFINKNKKSIKSQIIVEIKYSEKKHFSINDNFKIHINKNSKYVTGIKETMKL